MNLDRIDLPVKLKNDRQKHAYGKQCPIFTSDG